jgi:glutamyl-tRNA reductase
VSQHVDIVISSTSAPHYVLDKPKVEAAMKLRRHRPLLLIDIAVPRDIDPEVNFVESVYLYNIDDLQSLADNYLKQRQQEISKCELFIREKAAALLNAKAASYYAPLKLACGSEA